MLFAHQIDLLVGAARVGQGGLAGRWGFRDPLGGGCAPSHAVRPHPRLRLAPDRREEAGSNLRIALMSWRQQRVGAVSPGWSLTQVPWRLVDPTPMAAITANQLGQLLGTATLVAIVFGIIRTFSRDDLSWRDKILGSKKPE